MSMYPIATYTVSGTSTTSFSFSGIPQTFSHLQIRASWQGQTNTSGNSGYLRFNGDTGNNYCWHYILGSGSSVVAGNTTTTGSIIFGNYPWASGSSNLFTAGNIIDILDYTNTNKTKTIKCLNGYDTGGGIQAAWIFTGSWLNTAAITSISFEVIGSGNYFVPGSRFDLYGISNSPRSGA